MPPKQKTAAQLDIEKQRIISASLKIILKHGLEDLTMRRLGSKLHMSAANIYNYFHNKDEIYLHILITGFHLLYEDLFKATSPCKEPLMQIEAFVRTYVKFGINNKSYYELMFSSREPKPLDYVNTPMEKLARHKKNVSIDSLTLLNAIVKNCLPSKSDSEISALSLRIFCELHGFINLNNSNVLYEIDADCKRLTENIVRHILSDIQKQQDLTTKLKLDW